MIDKETYARIRHLFYAEHWKVGTIARELCLHPETVSRAVETERFKNITKRLLPCLTDPYLPFIRETLEQYPRLRATRIFHMVRDRGYQGSVVQLRRAVACMRPVHKEAYLCLRTFPGEQGQVDWAQFGKVPVGRAQRPLSCFVTTLSYSRGLYFEFSFDQVMESFLRGHVHAFGDWRGLPRILLYDNLRSVVLERRGDAIRFNPRLLELSAHYHFAARPCQVRAGNQKGRVERVIRYIRESFFAARPFTTLEDFNRQALAWRDQVAHRRPWPGDDSKTVEQAFEEEKPRLLPLPVHPFDTERIVTVQPGKTIYLRFDLNSYSIPPDAIGKPLVMAASEATIRILQGEKEIARHRRSYGRHEFILDPAHQEALLREKRKALGSTRGGRLAQAVPETEELLEAAFALGESAARQTTQLLELLEFYGPTELRAAVREALERKTPRASSVSFILNKRRRVRNRPVLPHVDLSHRPELEDLTVTPQDLETYDDLANNDDNDDPVDQ